MADSISFRETYADRLVSYSDEGSVFFDVVSSSSGTINASLTVPGLGSADLDDPELVFSFSVGGAEFSATLGEADTGTANSAVWFLYDDSERRAGQVSVSRVGDVARLSATARGLEGTIAAGEHTEDAEPGRTVPVAGQVPFRMELGGFSATRTLYYRGKASRVIRRVGSGEEAEEFELARVTLTGAADYTRPTITITSPRPGQRWSNEVILVTGRATDNVSVGEVMLSLNGEGYAAIESLEGGTWSHGIDLVPGTNVVRAYALDADGNSSAVASVRFVRIVTSPLTLIIDGPPSNTVAGVSSGQPLAVGFSYTATAKPGPTSLFDGWTGSGGINSAGTILRFSMLQDMTLTARFVPNPWYPIAGTYQGFFRPTSGNEIAATNAGCLTLTLTKLGKFTGRIQLAGRAFAFTGQANREGRAGFSVSRGPALPPLEFTLQFDTVAASPDASGTVASSGWQSIAVLKRAAAQRGETVAMAGQYTYCLDGADPAQSVTLPAGFGAGRFVVTSNGLATLRGTLADGTPIALSGKVATNGDWALCLPLYSNRGLLLGTVRFNDGGAGPDVAGPEMFWLKSAGVAGQIFYKDGFLLPTALRGTRYAPPAVGSNILNWTQGALLLDGGNLGGTISNQVTIAGNRISVLNDTNQFRLSFALPQGALTGSFRHPVTGRLTPVQGAAVQDASGGYACGWFRGTNESGYILLQP